MGTNSGPTAQGGSGACSAPGGLTVGLRVGLPSRAGLTRTAWRDRDKGASCTRELALLCRDFLESLVLCGGGCPVPPSRPRLPCPSQLPGGLSQGQHPPAPDMTREAGMESSPPPPMPLLCPTGTGGAGDGLQGHRLLPAPLCMSFHSSDGSGAALQRGQGRGVPHPLPRRAPVASNTTHQAPQGWLLAPTDPCPVGLGVASPEALGKGAGMPRQYSQKSGQQSETVRLQKRSQ